MHIKKMSVDLPVTVFFVGDMHIGNGSANIPLIDSVFKRIKNMSKRKNVLTVGMGDYIDAIIHKDKRYDYKTIDERHSDINKQEKKINKLFKSIKPTVVGLLEGNHEETIDKNGQNDILGRICTDIDIDFLGFLASIWINDVRIIVTHGSSNARMFESKIKVVSKFAENYPYDHIFAYGHMHERAVIYKPFLDNDGDSIIIRDKVMCLTGSFLQSYEIDTTCYAEKRLFTPLRCGWVELTIEKDGRIEGSVRG